MLGNNSKFYSGSKKETQRKNRKNKFKKKMHNPTTFDYTKEIFQRRCL